jgi:hypothetical protein
LRLVTLAHLIYGLHAFSAVTGLLSPAMIVTAFLTGWPSRGWLALASRKELPYRAAQAG